MDEQGRIRVAQIIGMSDGGVASIIMSYYRAIDKSKIQFDFYVESESKIINKNEIESLGGRVIFIPSYKKLKQYEKVLYNNFVKYKYDIVHSNMSTLAIFSLKVAKKAKIKIRIAHSHSTSNKKEWKKNFLKNILRPFSKKYATHYFACSELAGRYLFGNKTFNKGKVTIIHNAIDIDKFKFNKLYRDQIRKKLNIKNNEFIIGHVGRFMPQKNQEFLIKLFNEYLKLNSESRLLLIGDGELKQSCIQLVEKLNIQNNVIFLNPTNEIYKYYNAMDCFCLPSLYEGLPIVGVESQINGLFCIFSKNITKEIKLTNNIDFISLSNKKLWLSQLNNIANMKNDRIITYNNIDFSINLEANKLFNIYKKMILEAN